MWSTNLLLPLIFSFIVALIITPLVIKNARRLGILDNPQKRLHPARLHNIPVPRGGGIPIFAAIFVSSLLFLPFNLKLAGILAGGLLILAIGLWDDRQHVSPWLRLAVNAVAAVVVVISGINIPFVTSPLGGIINLEPILSMLIVIVWIMAITNMVSWSSGVDGQLAGFVPIAAATIGALSLRYSQDLTQWSVIILSVIVLGSYLGFLPWSAYPQKIMPGYSGGALAGYLLAVLAIVSGAKVATALIVLGIPVMDALFTILRRIILGRSPFWADAGHLHHRLLAAGWTKIQVALFYWIIAAILGFLVLHLNSQQKVYTILMLGGSVGVLLLWLTKFRQLLNP